MKLYNTLTRQIDTLKPLQDNIVKIYTCGITVYSHPHIGNWVGYIYWDVLQRALLAEGYQVERTQNFTDVGHLTSDDDNGEDKMEKGAKAEGLTAWDVAERYIEICDSESDSLNLLKPTHLIRATSLIQQQIDFVSKLEEKGYVYSIPEDGIYFDTSKLDDYGKLARLDIAGLEAGARVSVEGKKNITDFALWKFSPKDSKRDMQWESPWGLGFPGWHLECSVIARQTLGDQIDIHCGGIDHIPVHHTNEIAQTESLTGKKPFSQIWVHNNHVKVDGTKMSKSIGNIYTLDDIIAKGYSPMDFKMLVLSKHYRTEGNFTWEILEAAHNRLQNWRNIASLRWQALPGTQTSNINYDEQLNDLNTKLKEDLDTPGALALIDESFSKINVTITPEEQTGFSTFLESIDSLLGLDLCGSTPNISPEIEKTLADRSKARADKNWAESDKLRTELNNLGLEVKDTPTGQIWSYI
ncbi:cysteine--tRNA ligase [Candidatus Saccharibacteria bacterium]|nr:cysteine--tRNA ligase [Candidatus Saccharibacteria bacterium]